MDKITFQYHPDILTEFPNIKAGVILGRGLKNGETPPALKDAFFKEQQVVLEQIGDTPLSELPTLAAWRGAFRKFGVNPTKYRSAVEALLRRLTKKGDIPSINTLVDLGNLVSIRYRLPVAVFDVRQLQGAVTVHFARGDERFTPLFETEIEHPEPDEVVFSDPAGLVVARRWCWRQSDESAARPETTDVIICTEAHHENSLEDIQAALADLVSLAGEYAGGELASGVIGVEPSSIST
jgi:DNA/RNA-binding domain of Phe-tRNA-synthetase-like protein